MALTLLRFVTADPFHLRDAPPSNPCTCPCTYDQTDKGAGVVALTMFDLKKRGFVGDLHLAGVNGTKLPAIREYMRSVLGGLYPRSAFDFSCTTYPDDGKVDAKAYINALDALPKGSAVIIFTPDDTHFDQGACGLI